MMQVLWLCNIVLPDFSQEFAIKRNNYGGWMTGMLHWLEKITGIDISLCFPIMDKNRLRDGNCNGHNYYTFLCDMNAVHCTSEMIEDLKKIIDKERPDIIHIWGTEYPHTMAMLLACKEKGLLEKVVVHIQGLVSVYAEHYLKGIPEEYKGLKFEGFTSMEEDCKAFIDRGRYEVEGLKVVRHVIGRTDWDKAHVKRINPKVRYHFGNEILRDCFYKYAGKWKYSNCRKYSIFVSQASYPIKGFHYLLQALPDVIRRYPDAHVYVAGRNILDTKNASPYASYLADIMEQNRVKEAISFLGNLNEEQMIEEYLKANVFVLPSTIENSPNSLCEAKIIGVPSVSSFVGGTYTGSEPRKDGFLYPYDEPAMLAYYICKIFENENELCMEISNNAVHKALVSNDPETCINRTIMIYEEILKGL